jgi:hypothetical protein
MGSRVHATWAPVLWTCLIPTVDHAPRPFSHFFTTPPLLLLPVPFSPPHVHHSDCGYKKVEPCALPSHANCPSTEKREGGRQTLLIPESREGERRI